MMNPNYDPNWNADEELLPEDASQELEEVQEASLSRLSASPEEEQLHRRLALVDHLLRNAPLVKPSTEFAEKVIEAIRRRASKPFDRNIATGIILGLGSISALIAFSIIGLITFLLAILLNWTSVYQNLVMAAGNLRITLLDINDWMDSRLNTSPLMAVLSFAAVPMSIVWVWWMRSLGRVQRDS